MTVHASSAACALNVPLKVLATGGASLAPERLAETPLMLRGGYAGAVGGAVMTDGAGVLSHALKVKGANVASRAASNPRCAVVRI